MNNSILMITLTASLVTIAIRFAPFVIFSKKTPAWLEYLGKVLPYAIMAMLVVYCLKNVSFISIYNWLPDFISVVVVVLLHLWKRNTLLSVISGTLCYMILIQIVF